jgi:preprotein translocase subunit YajC
MDPVSLLLLVVVFGGLMWLMGAPQRRMRKEQAAMRERLAPGAEVMTHGGLYGTVVEVGDDVVVLETAPGVTMRWAARAIARIVEPLPDEDSEAEDAEYDADEEYDGEYDEEYEGEDAEYDEDDAEDVGEDAEGDDAGDDGDWSDVEVPDDASSLTEPDDDETTGR